jgi:hypothetical protein
LRSILAQLVSEVSLIPEEVQKLYDSYGKTQPPLDVLKLAFKSIIQISGKTFLIIDALDECPANDGIREQLCNILVEICKWSIPDLHILATSRKVAGIEETLAEIGTLTMVPIQNSKVNADIRLYVKSQIAGNSKLRRWAEKIDDIETTLVEKSNGMCVLIFFDQSCNILAYKSQVSLGLLPNRRSDKM